MEEKNVCEDALVIGIDIGGSHVTCILMNSATYKVIGKTVSKVIDRSADEVIDLICSDIYALLTLNEDLGKTTAIGIGVPGNVDPEHNIAKYLPNFPWEANVPLGSLIEKNLANRMGEEVDIPIYMRNDGRCAAIAESEKGAGVGANIFSMLTLGTGIGGALIINGVLFDGCSYDAGDFGHSVIRSDENAFPCVCGKIGCFETQASAQGLVKQYKKCHGSSYSTVSTGVLPINAEEVLVLYRSGDEVARTALNIYLDDLSTGLANLVTFYNPSVIALGGGLAQAAEVFDGLSARVDQKTLPATRGRYV